MSGSSGRGAIAGLGRLARRAASALCAAALLLGGASAQEAEETRAIDAVEFVTRAPGPDDAPLAPGRYLALEIDAQPYIAQRVAELGSDVEAALSDAGLARFHLSLEQGEPPALRIDFLDRDALGAAVALLNGRASGIGAIEVETLSTGRGLRVRFASTALERLRAEATDRTLERLEQRFAAIEQVEARLSIAGRGVVLVDMIGGDRLDLGPVLRSVRLSFHLVADPGVQASGAIVTLPYDATLNPAAAGLDERVFANAALSGDRVFSAVTAVDYNGAPGVRVRFDADGAARFATMTEQNLGRRIAIVLDGRIVSAPVVRGVITGGEALITGAFSDAEARALADNLNAGATPGSARVLEDFVVPDGR